MKSLNFSRWADRALSSALVAAIVITYSMTSLAAPSKPVGELIFSGGSGNNAVIVNGEAAKSGRTLFSDSTISTPDGATATLSLGRMGKIQLGPNTTLSLSAEQATFAGSLVSGSVTVLNSLEGMTIRNASGELVTLKSGETVEANANSAVRQTGSRGVEPWVWAVIIGAVAAVVLIAVASGGGDDSPPVSPIR